MSEALDELMPTGVRLTDDLIYLKGKYQIGEAALPYYSVSMGVEDAVSNLKLARDVVFEPKEPIRLDELFQRDVNLKRVEDEIVPYLERTHHLKFFNSLTVVLLPIDPARKVVLDGYPEPIRELVADGAIAVGGIQVKAAKNNPNVGNIRWSRDHIFPVIVDGQHRFSALKIAYNDPEFPWKGGLRDTQIPVLLILPHESVGYRLPPEDKDLTLLQACRTVFIDLNKHSVAVPPARRYLLDDQDPVAVCMRQILSDGTEGKVEGATQERIKEQMRLPLAVVNWVEGGPKFDKDEFLTSVITMYDLVRASLGRDTIPISDDYEENRDALVALKARLELSEELSGHLQASVDAAEREEKPFEFSMQQLKDIANEFRSGRGRFIWQTLSEFGPYVELLEGYTEKGLLGGDLENWMALDGPGRRAFEAAISEASMDKKPSEIAYDVWSGVKRKWPLAYQVVMQKVLVRSANNLFTSRASLSALWQTPGMGDMGFAEFHGLWMARCNDRLARHMGSADDPGISLWDGTVIHAVTKNMVFTEAAQNAAEALVAYVLAAPLGDWKSEPTKSAQKWVKDAWKHIGRGKKSTPEAAIFSQFGGPLRKAMQTVVILRCKANDDEPPEGDKLESQAANFLAERLALLVNNPG